MSTRKARLIDLEKREENSEPIQVLCLGMCRTGTSSLLAALKMLGYTPLHMSHIVEDTHLKRLWVEAIESTFIDKSSQKPYGRPEFDILLRGFDATLDIPCAIFADQLINAYPEAKVILTTRPVESWIKSMQGTIWQLMRWPSYRILRYVEPELVGSFLKLLEAIFHVHNGNKYGGAEAEEAFLAHNQRIRELVPAKNLLELSPPFDLTTLCDFLGKPTPSCGYPHVNSTDEYISRISERRNKSIIMAMMRLVKFLLQLLPVLIVSGGFWMMFK